MTNYDPSRPNQFKRLYNEYKKEKEIKKSEMLKSYTEELKRKKNLSTIVPQHPIPVNQVPIMLGKRNIHEISVNHEELEKQYQERTNISADDAYAKRLAMSQAQAQHRMGGMNRMDYIQPLSVPMHGIHTDSHPHPERRSPNDFRKLLLEGAVRGSTYLSEDQIKSLQKEMVRQCNKYGLVTDFQYNPSDGSCLITFKTFEMAEKACSKLDGRVFDGQSISCVLLQ